MGYEDLNDHEKSGILSANPVKMLDLKHKICMLLRPQTLGSVFMRSLKIRPKYFIQNIQQSPFSKNFLLYHL